MADGLKVWLMSLISYDKYGNATVLKSFSKVAKESPIKQGKKVVKGAKKSITKKSGEKELW